jgi:hypothetical protein
VFDLAPHFSPQRLVVSSARDENQTLRPGQCGQHTAGMLRPRVSVGRSVDTQYRTPDVGSRFNRTHGVHGKVTPQFGELKGTLDDAGGEEDWRALCRDGTKIGERLHGDDGRHARVVGGFLNRHRGPKRGIASCFIRQPIRRRERRPTPSCTEPLASANVTERPGRGYEASARAEASRVTLT